MHAPEHPLVTVIACGEPLRGDDGVAHAAIDEIPDWMRQGAAVQHVTALGPEDLAGLDPDSVAVVVDAVLGIPAGEIVRFDLDRLPLHPPINPTSSHQLPLDMVVGLAKLMGWEPRGAFIGVGAARFDHGHVISPEVRRVVPLVGEAIASEIERARLNASPVADWAATHDAPAKVGP